MEAQTLARPYAKAVFEVANAGQALPAWGDFLGALATTVRDARVAALVRSPVLTREQQAEAVAGVLADAGCDQLDAWPHMRALVQLLAQNRRLALAPGIAALFDALRAQAESRIDVQITSAVAVQAPQTERLQTAIAERLGRSVDVTWDTDPELLGGAVIRAGDLVIDGSIKGELERLSQALGR